MDAPKSGLNLLDLPNEILLWIIDHATCLEDLENFTRCSKLICILATKTLSIRRARKRKYSIFVVGDVNFYEGNHVRQRVSTVPDQQHPIFALQKLLTESSIPDYCKTLRIGDANNEGAMTGRYGDRVAVEAATIARNLNETLSSIDCNRTFLMAFDRLDLDGMQEGFYALAWAVPLIALPNIETLEMVNCSEFLQLLPVFPDMRPTHHHLKQVGLFGNWNASLIETRT
ncbi:MAG: hypothetical protein L6R42_002429 [Xanthoria sp. 1 TBL-2021]|nr:MAG: hypothetical protein L6R42_002429 [Xanthoria sp. 1 TBL-2021]